MHVLGKKELLKQQGAPPPAPPHGLPNPGPRAGAGGCESHAVCGPDWVCHLAPSPEAPKQVSPQNSTPVPHLYLQAGCLPWRGPSITSRLGWGWLGSPLCLTPQFCFSSRVLTVLRGGGRERRSRRGAPANERSVTPRPPESPALTPCRLTAHPLEGGS